MQLVVVEFSGRTFYFPFGLPCDVPLVVLWFGNFEFLRNGLSALDLGAG